MEIVNHVKSTSDYSLFTTLVGNRVIDRLHVERLKRSFKKAYLLSPILVNENYAIIDGQHRFLAAQDLGLPIYFICVEGYALSEVQTLNTNMKNWKKEDYLNAYCDIQHPEYLKMRQFMTDFPQFGIAAAEMILTNSSDSINNSKRTLKLDGKSSNARVRYFQEGSFVVSDLEKAYQNAEKIMMLKDFYDGYTRSAFIATMVRLFKNENYNHNQMIQKMRNSQSMIRHCNSVTEYKKQIEEIYNFWSHKKVSLRY